MKLRGCVVKRSPEQEKRRHNDVLSSYGWGRSFIKVMGKPVLAGNKYSPHITPGVTNLYVRGWFVFKLKPKNKHPWVVMMPSSDPKYKHRFLRNKANRRRYFATPADAIIAADKAASQIFCDKIAIEKASAYALPVIT